jgi:hypothetical protein
MAPHALIAQHALLLVLTQLHALALLISTGKMRQMVALIALQALMHLLNPLPFRLASARPTTTEKETELHAPLAPTVEPLPRKRRSQLKPRSILTALARRTPMEPTPRLVALNAVHRITHLVDPQTLLLAHALPL